MGKEAKPKEEEKETTVKRKYRKKYKLSDLLGCFKGQIIYTDAVFNLGQ